MSCLCSTYLITQFQALGTEVRTFTSGHISATTAVLVAAGLLLIFDLLGGMRAVAYTDVMQGFILLVGSIIFVVIQRTSLGGLPAAAMFYRCGSCVDSCNASLCSAVPGIVTHWSDVLLGSARAWTWAWSSSAVAKQSVWVFL
jgi:Na+/proline symporter